VLEKASCALNGVTRILLAGTRWLHTEAAVAGVSTFVLSCFSMQVHGELRERCITANYYTLFTFLNESVTQNCASGALPTLMAYAQGLTPGAGYPRSGHHSHPADLHS